MFDLVFDCRPTLPLLNTPTTAIVMCHTLIHHRMGITHLSLLPVMAQHMQDRPAILTVGLCPHGHPPQALHGVGAHAHLAATAGTQFALWRINQKMMPFTPHRLSPTLVTVPPRQWSILQQGHERRRRSSTNQK